MLPRTDGLGITEGNGLHYVQCPHGIGDNAILGPITSTDDIAGTGAGNADRPFLKVGVALSGRGNLSHCLAGAIGIMPAKRIRLLVGTTRLMVLVTLVRGDNHNGAGT